MTAPNWRRLAACRGADRALFFGDWGEKPEAQAAREAKAKAVCEGCPVRRECLTLAVLTPVRYGVWGGTGERERTQIRRNYLRRQQRRAA